MKLSKVRMLGISILLVSAMAMSVFAYEYVTSKQIPVGIVVETPTVQLGVYWDLTATDPVTTIDFGVLVQPSEEQYLEEALYIKNEGDVTLTIYWSSTLNIATSEITEGWALGNYYPGASDINGTTIDPTIDPVLQTTYWIHLPQYVSVGTYNWTLTVWGEY